MAKIAKTMKLTATFLSLFAGAIAIADTPLKTSQEVIRLEGHARSTTAISALIFYTPLYNFDKKLSAKACEFAEDHWSPNGDNRSLNIKAVRQADGSYSVQVPIDAQRGSCPYVLDSLYLSFKDGVVNETINLLTDRIIQKQKEDTGDDSDVLPINSFTELKDLYCDFEDEMGLCTARNGLIDLSYSIANKGTNYLLNLQDIKDRPERQY